ncbi:MAG: baseplate J/gp47 family protein [Methanobrevibacter sp.]|nr:baseplate J/gp47 family protein [Methanobrevibacter sp.]MBP5785369.1 baseplate J/gp47 family protein [Methanobrevibacter sp.]
MDSKNYNTLLAEMKQSAIAGGSGLTDFNSGSNTMNIFEATARPIEQAYIDTRNGYTNNLRAIPYSVFDFKQKTGQKAAVDVVFKRNEVLTSISTIPSGTRISDGSLVFITTSLATIPAAKKSSVKLVFTRNETSGTESLIPTGTKVSNSNGSVVFTTTEPGVIESGETQSGLIEAKADNVGEAYNLAENTLTVINSTLTPEITSVNNPQAASGGSNGSVESNPVGAIAEEVGLQYNVKENTITTIESNLSAEIVGVTNPAQAVGGTDAETQTQMLRRFKYYINGLQGSNKYGIMAGVLGVEGVRSVGIEEHFPLKDIYNFTVYVDDGTGQLSTALKNEILDLINGTDTEENPGLRAAGINCEVTAATIVPITIELTATIYRVEDARIQNDITVKLQEYINGLGIHENVVLSSIIVLLKQIPGITDISGLTINDSTDNIIISEKQIARFYSVEITIVNQ